MKQRIILSSLISILFSAICLTAAAQSIKPVISGKYYQEISTKIALPQSAESTIIKLFKEENKVIAVASNGVFRYEKGAWTGKPSGTGWLTATIDKLGKVWLANQNTIQKEGDDKKLTLPETASHATIKKYERHWQ